MQIEFSSSGGVFNREREYQVDTSTLPQEQARELESLVESSDAFELRQEDMNPSVAIGRADVITYHISISDGTRHVNYWLNDITVPASIRLLLERLQDLARKQKGR